MSDIINVLMQGANILKKKKPLILNLAPKYMAASFAEN
jgi:hypothetical protein